MKTELNGEERFRAAKLRVIGCDEKTEGVGGLNEKTLHRILKFYFEPRIEFHERKLLGRVADVLNESGVIEIQTRAMEKMNPKLSVFLHSAKVTLVIPLAKTKSVTWVDTENGSLSKARKSPRGEGIFDALFEMSKIKEHLFSENLTVKLLFLDVSEYRYLNGYGASKKRGARRLDRIPNAIISELDVNCAHDVFLALKDALPTDFTAKTFAALTKKGSRKNYYILKLLLDIGVVKLIGKEGRAHVYALSET